VIKNLATLLCLQPLPHRDRRKKPGGRRQALWHDQASAAGVAAAHDRLAGTGRHALTAFRLWINAGLVLGLAGDILLLRGERGFLPGLISFLLGHLAYIFAFSTGMAGCPCR
jgi:uncharacterized membrane protein YhhN